MQVFSLVCWGGRTGKSVTASNSSGLLFASTNHGLRDGTGLVFSGTTAPGNVTFGVTYYAKSLSANTFAIYTEAALTNRVAWSSAGSGVIAKSALMLDYFDQYPGRWGDAGSERCYDGLFSWASGRAVASAVDEEVCELGQAFTEIVSSSLQITVPCAVYTITSMLAGKRSEAFHAGTKTAGYCFANSTTNRKLRLTRPQGTVEGFVIEDTSSNYRYQATLELEGFLTKGRNIIVAGNIASISTSVGVLLYGQISSIENSLVYGFYEGISLYQYTGSPSILNCTATKNTTGINAANTGGANGNGASVIDTISIGNTTLNWYATNVTDLRAATNNLGGTGEAWIYGTGTRIEVTETSPFSALFVDWTNNDFRPASASSDSVDTGVEYYGALIYDIADAERPNYNNGGAEAFDVGCYEFDHGYGDHPITATLTLTGLSVGSDVVVRSAGTSTILASVDQVTGSTWEYTYGATHSVDIDVIKPGLVLVPFRNLALTASDSSLPVSQQLDRNYQ